jgi:tetratricopeptide (TPR) repeat protein
MKRYGFAQYWLSVMLVSFGVFVAALNAYASDGEEASKGDRNELTAKAHAQMEEMTKKISEAKSPKGEWYEWRGDAYMLLRKYDLAYEDFSTAATRTRGVRGVDRYKSLRKLMEAAIQVGYHQEALEIARTLEFTTPRSPTLLSLIALLQAGSDDEEVHDPVASLETAKSALKYEPKGGDVVTVDLALAAAFSVNGDFTKAVHFQERAITNAGDQAADEWKSQLDKYKEKKPFRLTSKAKKQTDRGDEQ